MSDTKKSFNLKSEGQKVARLHSKNKNPPVRPRGVITTLLLIVSHPQGRAHPVGWKAPRPAPPFLSPSPAFSPFSPLYAFPGQTIQLFSIREGTRQAVWSTEINLATANYISGAGTLPLRPSGVINNCFVLFVPLTPLASASL